MLALLPPMPEHRLIRECQPKNIIERDLYVAPLEYKRSVRFENSEAFFETRFKIFSPRR